jgi:hypothetical protein
MEDETRKIKKTVHLMPRVLGNPAFWIACVESAEEEEVRRISEKVLEVLDNTRNVDALVALYGVMGTIISDIIDALEVFL